MNKPIEAPFATQDVDVSSYWLPFTANRRFKSDPAARVIVSGEGAYYRTATGRTLFDCLSGLWCCPLGHGHPKLVEALTRQARTLDYGTAFQMSNPVTLKLAERIAGMAPEGLDHVFFANSGSESVDTALKIALGYHRLRGDASRIRMIGRERGYHGAGFGGISVGGMVGNRKLFAPLMLPGVDHLPHTYNAGEMAFSRGQPAWGAHLADDLERIVALHDASTIAAVIVEPMQGSSGVIVPPIGYLQRLREICTKHGILLIFDEVITAFGRMGEKFGAVRFGVVPDMIVFAKVITNGVVPMGGVIVTKQIYDAFMTGPAHAIEFMHGYTYSGHPLAAAVAHATLDVIRDEGLVERAKAMEPVLADAMHSLKGERGVQDVRNIGMAAAVDLESVPGQPGLRAQSVFEAGIADSHLFRFTADTIAVGPPFVSTKAEIEGMVDALRKHIRSAF
jgi:beta-alanine--pyruvate transaminase